MKTSDAYCFRLARNPQLVSKSDRERSEWRAIIGGTIFKYFASYQFCPREGGRKVSRAMLLDRVVGESFPSLASAADVKSFEGVPSERIAANSTFDAIKMAAKDDPDAFAIQFLPNANPEDAPLTIT
jgi:hypothetical protein